MSKEHYHFLGIFGHAMRGVAAAVKDLGRTVTGTDEGDSPPTDWLRKQDIRWWSKPDPRHLQGVTTVIISGRIEPDNPELVAAQRQGIPVFSFAELVGDLTKRARRIVIAGTHGKTTTTSLLAWTFESAKRHPDYLVGIQPKNFPSTVRLADGALAVIEGDEYRSSLIDDRSKFAHYRPATLILTSIEHDHPDFFQDLAAVRDRFAELIKDLPADGRLVHWAGSETVREVAEAFPGERHSYAFEDADWYPEHPRYEPDGIRFVLKHHDDTLGELIVPIYGEHNVLNAVAAAAVALQEGLSFEEVAKAFTGFKGAARRFELISEPGADITVIDDYAHHPTEARTTIRAAKLHYPGRRVIAVYQPHTYSRTKELLSEYHQAFGDADQAFITKIEDFDPKGVDLKVSGSDVAAGAGKRVRYVEDRGELLDAVVKAARPGDVILSMSVSGNDSFAQKLAKRLGGDPPEAR
ncbi:MAG: UDP-N-acetylmuramate--L-alanine ligase [bacterium]|nr:UDP-N-acetylmuramate--L-alanine ligase [bacterium]MDZ4247843.1 UDP-N-acetylmuramate--L-alanine ligase [Patescibacteria group bacterium]